MVNVNIAICYPEDEEQDCSIQLRMPAMPQAGDEIQILRKGKVGCEYLLVRRTKWNINENDEEKAYLESAWVVAEYADGSHKHEAYAKMIEKFKKGGRKVHFVTG